MSRRNIVLGALAAIACFAAGVASTRLMGPATPSAPQSDAGPGGPSLFRDAGPKILFDPDSITLLPDASLRLELPAPPFDGGLDAGR